MPESTAVVATGIFHHPAGVLLPGEAAELPSDIADQGIALGVLVAQAVPVEAPALIPTPVVPTSTQSQE